MQSTNPKSNCRLERTTAETTCDVKSTGLLWHCYYLHLLFIILSLPILILMLRAIRYTTRAPHYYRNYAETRNVSEHIEYEYVLRAGASHLYFFRQFLERSRFYNSRKLTLAFFIQSQSNRNRRLKADQDNTHALYGCSCA